jgi:hypothetical protein
MKVPLPIGADVPPTSVPSGGISPGNGGVCANINNGAVINNAAIKRVLMLRFICIISLK